MRTWMILWAAAFVLLVAPTVWAEPPDIIEEVDSSDHDLGLDFDGDLAAEPASRDGLAPAPSESAEVQNIEGDVAGGQDVAAQAGDSASLDARIQADASADSVAIAQPTDDDGAAPGPALEAESVESEMAEVEMEEDGLNENGPKDAGWVPSVEGEQAEALSSPDGDFDAQAGLTTLSKPAPMAKNSIGLGPLAEDEDGQIGRIHTVSRGDTLWDISNAYLGTPWVWPSVWNDNDGISDPHRIAPGDRIWITAGEMRIVTERQADDMIAAVPDEELAAETDWAPIEEADDPPAAMGEEDDLMAASAPSSMDELPVTVPTAAPATHTGAMVRVSEAESLGYVSPDGIEAAGSIVDSPEERTWLAEGDRIMISLGEGEVEVGDEFTIYRDTADVRDLDGTLLGYHVEVLGWAVVRSTDAESSLAVVRQSQYEIRRGDNVIPRDPVEINVPVKLSPDALPGHIIYMPDSRTAMADGEWVYVNRGNLHGVDPGTELEVYVPGRMIKDKATGRKVLTPDTVVAQMIVVDTQPDSAVAYIVHSRRELAVGDKVRPVPAKLAQR